MANSTKMDFSYIFKKLVCCMTVSHSDFGKEEYKKKAVFGQE